MSIQEKTYVSKRTGKTVIQYCAVVYDARNKKYIWSKRCETKKEARQCERILLEELEKGTTQDKNMLFESLTNQWLAVAPSLYANTTYRGYEWYTKTYILPVFGDVKATTITPVHIQTFITAMSKQYSAETVNKSLNILSNIFQFGNDMRVVSYNPCEKIKRVRVANRKHTTWDEDQIIYFLSIPNVKCSMYYDMFILSFSLGIRPSELCGISESDFVNNGILSLNRGYDRYGVVTDLKTEASHRPLELSDLLIKLLNRRIIRKKEMRLRLSFEERKEDHDFLFTNSKGQPVNPNNYSKAFKKLLRTHNRQLEEYQKEHGTLPLNAQILPDIRLYDARHSFATNNILSNSASIKVISEILGHSTVKTTLHNYSHVTQSMNKKAIDEYSKKLLGKVSL